MGPPTLHDSSSWGRGGMGDFVPSLCFSVRLLQFLPLCQHGHLSLSDPGAASPSRGANNRHYSTACAAPSPRTPEKSRAVERGGALPVGSQSWASRERAFPKRAGALGAGAFQSLRPRGSRVKKRDQSRAFCGHWQPPRWPGTGPSAGTAPAPAAAQSGVDRTRNPVWTHAGLRPQRIL